MTSKKKSEKSGTRLKGLESFNAAVAPWYGTKIKQPEFDKRKRRRMKD